MSLTIQYRRKDGIEILNLAGQLTLGDGTGALRAAIQTASHNAVDLLVNLSGVSYLDSAGLGELVGRYSNVTSKGKRMKLLNPQKRVDALLQITKLYSTFECFTDEREGLESFS